MPALFLGALIGAVASIIVPPLSLGWFVMMAWWAGMVLFGLFTSERR